MTPVLASSMQTMQWKHVHGAFKSVDRAKREIEFIATRQEVDADGEVIVTRGVELSRYRKNPTLLLEHDRTKRFGRVDSLTLQPVAGADALVGRAAVLPAGVSAAADQAYQELLHGALGGVSVGFVPVESDTTAILPGQRGRTFHRIELHEISVVSLPACSSCVVTAKAARARPPLRDDLLEIDADVFAAAWRELLRETIARELTAQVDLLRGRVD